MSDLINFSFRVVVEMVVVVVLVVVAVLILTVILMKHLTLVKNFKINTGPLAAPLLTVFSAQSIAS